jgi:hypothetical protein
MEVTIAIAVMRQVEGRVWNLVHSALMVLLIVAVNPVEVV